MIPAYFILGTPASGRRGIAFDAIEKGTLDTDFTLVFVSKNEDVSDFDSKIESAQNAGIEKYSDISDALEKIASLDSDQITRIFFLADSTKNLADEVEAFKSLVDARVIQLVRVWSVVDCTMATAFPKETQKYVDALSHFADVLMLSRRSGISNKAIADITARYEKMRHPHIITLVDKNFRTKNPIELMIDEARRITMIFDDFDPIDELDIDEDNLPEEPFSLERKPDPYLARLQSGIRQNPIENPVEYVKKSQENKQ